MAIKRFDAAGDRNPTLRTPHPYEVAWSEPTCVIKSARLEDEHILYISRDLIDADAAIRTEHAGIFVATVSDARKLLRRPGHRQAVFLHQHGHAESTAG